MGSHDEHVGKFEYANELGEEWTEVEPGIYVRVEQRLQPVDADAYEGYYSTKEAS